MAAETADARLQRLLDREDILECLTRYARGIDRLDIDLFRSAFHEDAVDCRGGQIKSIDAFLEGWLPTQPDRDVMQHFLTNATVDIDGDTAHVESYHLAVVKSAGSATLSLNGGRYIDRFERRDGEWKIAVRLVVPSWRGPLEGLEIAAGRNDEQRTPRDPSYERPLAAR